MPDINSGMQINENENDFIFCLLIFFYFKFFSLAFESDFNVFPM